MLFRSLAAPAGLFLILLSISVLTVTFDRIRFWIVWWRRKSYQNHWNQVHRLGGTSLASWIEEREDEMRFGESYLDACIFIAPLLGLIGTVLALSQLLAAMGPQLVLPPDNDFSGFGDALISTVMGLMISLTATITLHLNRALVHQIGRAHV